MAKHDPARFVIPDEATPRLYGRITLVVAAILLACAVGTGEMYLMAPVAGPLSARAEGWSNRFYHESLRKRLDVLTRRESEAKTPAEKAAAAKVLDEFLAEVPPSVKTMSPGMSAMEGPIVRAYGLIDSFAGVALNVAMLVGAAGLTGLREWGRRTTLLVAGLKLARIAAFAVVMLGWVLPVQIRAMMAAMGPMMAGPGGKVAAAPGMTAATLAAMSTGGVIGWALAAAVFPALLLVILTKPRVRAACVGAGPPAMREV